MAAGFQQTMWIGNLGADPELRMTPQGQAVLNFRVACTETYLDRNKVRQEHTEWMSVVVWGKRAEALAKFLGKGAGVTVIGKLRTSTYDDRDGVKRYKTELKATEVILGARGRGSAGEREPADDYESNYAGAAGAGDGDDIPF